MTSAIRLPRYILGEAGAQRGRDGDELRIGDLGIDRQREDLPRGALGMREPTLRIAEVGVRRLAMERNRVVHARPDPRLLQSREDPVAVGEPDDEEVVHRLDTV